MNGNDRLTYARQADAELSRLERARADLPILEAEEKERQAQQQAQQRGANATAKFERLLGEYAPSKKRTNLELIEACHQFVDAIRRSQTVDKRWQEMWKLAQQMAQARILAGQTEWTFGPDVSLNQATVTSVAQQVMREYDVPQLSVVSSPYSGPEIQAVLALAAQFVDIAQTAKPQQITSGKVLIKARRDGQDVQYWG